MSSEIKNQHYLPYTYLKHFKTIDSESKRNKAKIYVDDGESVVLRKVERQCFEKWFYRTTNTQESEQGFGKFESDWNQVLKRARQGHDESALIMMQILMYHFRNISIRHLIPIADRYDLIIKAVITYIEQKIMKLPSGVNFADNPDHVQNFPWLAKIVVFDEPLIITSDNPAVLTFTSNEEESFGPFILPISPTELFVSIDKTKFKFLSTVGSEKDSYIANAFVAAQKVEKVFYHRELSSEDRSGLWGLIRRDGATESSRGKFEESRFIPGLTKYESNKFSFLEEI